jgi:ABC-type transporter MlaC component
MTRQTRSLDTPMLQRAQRIAAVTLASLALGAPALAQAQAAAPPAQQQATDKAASDAFKRADANQDGKLSKEESARMPAIAAKFDELDKDKDGSLSMDEFMAGYAK